MAKINKIPDFLAMAKEIENEIVTFASEEGVAFFKKSFDNEGFTDIGLEKWVKTKETTPFKILEKTGSLQDSIHVVDASIEQITFVSDTEYSEIHNEGGRIYIPITDKSRKFFWFMFKKTGAEKWKWMALTKDQQFSFIMPPRKFMGESITLMNFLDREYATIISEGFKRLKNTN